jgi:RNA polymerase sigma-70 factor (ECF subfamily)
MTLLAPIFAKACKPAVSAITLPIMARNNVDLEALLALIAQGDRLAFRQLYDEISARLLGAARRILGDHALAEDAVQDAFLRIWRSAGKFDPARGVALAWIGRIVRNASFDRLPAQRDMERIEDVEIAVLPAEPADARVAQCLKKLPDQQGQAVILMYVHGLTHPELADHFGAPLGTVKSWVRRGSTTLRECLGVL